MLPLWAPRRNAPATAARAAHRPQRPPPPPLPASVFCCGDGRAALPAARRVRQPTLRDLRQAPPHHANNLKPSKTNGTRTLAQLYGIWHHLASNMDPERRLRTWSMLALPSLLPNGVGPAVQAARVCAGTAKDPSPIAPGRAAPGRRNHGPSRTRRAWMAPQGCRAAKSSRASPRTQAKTAGVALFALAQLRTMNCAVR